MPLIFCPECHNQVSDQAENCPHCGYPIKTDDNNKNKNVKKPLIKQWWFWVILLFVLVLIGKLITPSIEYEDTLPRQQVNQQQVDHQAIVNKIDSALETTFGKEYSAVQYSEEDKTYYIYTWGDYVTAGVIFAQEGETANIDAWNDMVNTFVTTNIQIKEAVEKLGDTESSVSLTVQNEINKDRTLLLIIDGEVIYNVMEDK